MKTLSLVLIFLFLVSVMGCGTIKGIGEDMSALGGWMTKSSDKVKYNNATP